MVSCGLSLPNPERVEQLQVATFGVGSLRRPRTSNYICLLRRIVSMNLQFSRFGCICITEWTTLSLLQEIKSISFESFCSTSNMSQQKSFCFPHISSPFTYLIEGYPKLVAHFSTTVMILDDLAKNWGCLRIHDNFVEVNLCLL